MISCARRQLRSFVVALTRALAAGVTAVVAETRGTPIGGGGAIAAVVALVVTGNVAAGVAAGGAAVVAAGVAAGVAAIVAAMVA
eukprot:CAMPEP_0118811574 /NCGR_PEP_ID=MMETSP1162-20130426/1732_1 /TAXON_ID=33656 /ORGANISM="Phaeocystis Sp, Strain CCMP2710" /LENGTH=83 /DNA_ID=CAMNT_0006741219 /DNA_START=201 /DNA_END=452 /DNA_ORIENTATION=+